MNTIIIGGGRFIDISAIVGPDVKPRAATIGLAVHHTAGGLVDVDANFSGTTEDEELAHIAAINAQHLANGWSCGFGYNAIAFASGRVYVVGRCAGQRAHVAKRNHELAGCAMAGDYSVEPPPPGCIAGVGRWVRAMWAEYGAGLPVMGHGQWALPGEGTACPGAATSIAAILDAAMEGDDMSELDDLRRDNAILTAGVRDAHRLLGVTQSFFEAAADQISTQAKTFGAMIAAELRKWGEGE